MRILHTSDWHIGRQFHHVALLDDQRYVLQQIIDIAEREKIDVLLIAGDLYDRAVPPANAVSLVDEMLNRLCNDLNIPVIIIAGNHDGPERLGFASRQLREARLYMAGPLTRTPQSIVLEDQHGEVVFYAIPYADPPSVRTIFPEDNSDDLRSHDQCMAHIMQQIPEHKNQRSVVLSHCFLAGASECESERPLSVGGADQVSHQHFKGFDYAALGHLHQAQKRNSEHIRYSGSPLKYSFSEVQHNKSVTLVDMDAKGACEIREIALNALRDVRTVSGALDEIIAAAKDDANPEDYVMIKLSDTHAILDPMLKLRAVYPNVLHLERPGLMALNVQKLSQRELLNKGELSLFKDFYQQVQNEPLSTAQEKILKTLLDEIHSAQEI